MNCIGNAIEHSIFICCCNHRVKRDHHDISSWHRCRGALIAVLLIMLLSSKELISSTTLNSLKIKKAMNLAIMPLLAVFVLDVAFMVMM